MLAQTQYTIVDLSDPIVSDAVPTNPTKDMLWLDISKPPSVLKRGQAVYGKW